MVKLFVKIKKKIKDEVLKLYNNRMNDAQHVRRLKHAHSNNLF